MQLVSVASSRSLPLPPSSFSLPPLFHRLSSRSRAYIPSLSLSLLFLQTSRSAMHGGKAGKETRGARKKVKHSPGRWRERETSCSRFFAVRETFDLVKIPLISPMRLSSRATKRAATSLPRRHKRSRYRFVNALFSLVRFTGSLSSGPLR